MVGGFIMFLVHLKDNVEPEQGTATVEQKEATKAKVIEPTFDFYTLLPEMEVVVDNQQQAQTAVVTTPPPTQIATATSAVKESFLLQAGSFRSVTDADARKAELAFLGVESKVQKVTIDNKDTWHRVQIGPISGREQADVLQKKLKQNNIDSLLMRAKHG